MHEAGVHHVVGILVVQLPVGAILGAEDAAGLLDFPLRRAVDEIVNGTGHWTKIVLEAWPARSKAAEDEATIGGNARNPREAQALLAKIEALREPLAVGHAGEAAVEAILPSVIGTDETCCVAVLGRAEARAAMG